MCSRKRRWKDWGKGKNVILGYQEDGIKKRTFKYI